MPDTRIKLYTRFAIVAAGFALVFLAASVYLIGQVNSLRNATQRSERQDIETVLNQRVACERGNGLRFAIRWLLDDANAPERVKQLAGVQQRDCAADYPLP